MRHEADSEVRELNRVDKAKIGNISMDNRLTQHLASTRKDSDERVVILSQYELSSGVTAMGILILMISLICNLIF